MKKNKEKIVVAGLLLLLLVLTVGISYAAFRYTGTGTKVNTITSGNISMSFTESDNVISIDKALPTTDNTGVRTLEDGEYFDFTVTSNIKGNSYINYEISVKAIEGNTFDPNYVKLYLSKVNEDGTETSVKKGVTVRTSSVSGTVPTYKEEVMANNNTGRPAGEMSLLTGTVSSQGEVTTKYRLRMYVAEEYNPQGDGGNKTFGVKVNVYGKNEAMTGPVLKAYNDNPARTNAADLPQTDFHADTYRKNITSIVTKGDTTIPEGVIESWDMSVAGDNSVIAYVEDDGSGSGTYKLTIGGNGKIIANPDMSYYFLSFSKLTSVDLSNLDTSKVTDMHWMFFSCSSLTELDLSSFDTLKVIDMSNMFSGCSSLIELDLSRFDTSKVTYMNSMFNNCRNLTNLDLTSFDTSNVTNMNNMFYMCSSLIGLDLSSFDTSNVTDMGSMFAGYDFDDIKYMSLTKIIFGEKFSTLNVMDMQRMFYNCSSLTELDLSSFNTSKVTDMHSMFSNCSSLIELDLTSFDTSKVTNMASMFENTTNLTQVLVDRNKWIIGSNTNINSMFYGSGVSQVTYV